MRQRAICGVLLSVVGNAGTLIAYTIGIFVNWRQLAAILVTFAIPYIIGLIVFLPNDYVVHKYPGAKRYRKSSTGNQTYDDVSSTSFVPANDVKKNINVVSVLVLFTVS
jgi:hypothetical protein